MLTIVAMVRVGPWTLEGIYRVPKSEPMEACKRCRRSIREVWVFRVDEGYDLAKLDGQPVWRIGSECGPHLEEVNAEIWKQQMKPVTARLALVKRLEAVLKTADAKGYTLLPTFFAERLQPLREGTLDIHLMRHTGGCMAQYERALGLKPPVRARR